MISTERSGSFAMSDQTRRILTPGASRKRKERDGPLDTFKASTTTSTTTVPTAEAEPVPVPVPPPSSNRILAGYLAHEFLTQGSLFGQKWDSARTMAPPLPTSSDGPPLTTSSDKAETEEIANANAVETPANKKKTAYQRYAAVANLMKADGTHIPGIVNPTQLSQWLEI